MATTGDNKGKSAPNNSNSQETPGITGNDATIKEALEFSDLCIKALKNGNRLPYFSYEL